MKKIISSAIIAAFMSTGVASAADGVQKEITIVANINSAIFVSKPDGSTWYDKEELYATNYKQEAFASKDLPVRIWTTDNEVHVSLVQPLTVARADGTQLSDVTVNFAGKPLAVGSTLDLTQTNGTQGSYDSTYTLKINAKAPTTASGSNNGAYQGDLVMLFEPKP